MPETAYTVRARIVVDPPRLDQVNRRLSVLDRLTSRLSTGLRGNLLRGFAPLLASGAVVGGIAMVSRTLQRMYRGIVTESVRLGSGVEDVTMSVAALQSALGGLGQEDALRNAQAVVRQLRRDAASLPATFDQVAESYRSIFEGGALAGMSQADILKLNRLAVVGASATGSEASMVADQIRRAITESASSETRFASTALAGVGMSTTAFNALSRQERATTLLDAIERSFAGAAGLAATTWTAQWATFTDRITNLTTDLLLPTFEVLKDAVGTLNEAFDGDTSEAAQNLGRGLALLVEPVRWTARAFKRVRETMDRFPSVSESFVAAAQSFGDVMSRLGEILGPILESRIARRLTALGAVLTAGVRYLDTQLRQLETKLLGFQFVVASVTNGLVQIANRIGITRFGTAVSQETLNTMLTRELAGIWAREGKKRDDTIRDVVSKNKKTSVKVDLGKVEWGDTRSLSSALERAFNQFVEQSAQTGAYGLTGVP